MANYKVTFSDGIGGNSYQLVFDDGTKSNSTSMDYNTGDGRYYNAIRTKKVASITPKSVAGYTFNGLFDDDGTECVSSSGVIKKLSVSAGETWTAQYTARKYTLTFNPNGGQVSPTSKGDIPNGQPVGTLPVPTWSGHRFIGWYTEATGGDLVTEDTPFSWASNKTIYAHWESPHTLTLNPNGSGASVTPTSIAVFTGDALGQLPTPFRSGYNFKGWYTASDGGDYVDASTVYEQTGDSEIFARWTTDEVYRITLNPNGGTVSPRTLYVSPGEQIGPNLNIPDHETSVFEDWYDDDGNIYTPSTVYNLHRDLTLKAKWYRTEYTIHFNPNGGTVSPASKQVTIDQPIGQLPTPTLGEYGIFKGWYTARDGGTKWTSSTFFHETDDVTLYAHWEIDPDYVRTISFNAEGGTVSPSELTFIFGLPIDGLPTPTKSGKIFRGWWTTKSGGTRYTDGMTCDWYGTLTLHAHWIDDAFGNLTDWFGLETSNGPLMLVASTDGATRSVTMTSHSGALAIQTADSSVGAFERGGILLNPTCTYRIRKEGTVQIQLGKAWAKTGTVKSGYMIVSAEYATASDGKPVLVILGVANEGADAINRWNVNLSVNPDHIAQDPMGAVSGGGEMTECKTLVTCDPVVPMENGMPCASDVVHGKVVVTATTNAYLGESAPTAAGSFVETNGEPNSETDVDFTTYAFQAERSL